MWAPISVNRVGKQMASSSDPPFDAEPQGISLDELARAFSQVMQTEPAQRDDAEPVAGEAVSLDEDTPTAEAAAVQRRSDGSAEVTEATEAEAVEATEEDPCPINPRTILEAMLFVGNDDNRPLTPKRAAEVMRDVSVEEIPPLIDELNRRYDASAAPYRIVGTGAGYRLALRPEYRSLRNRFLGRAREARLSQAAIDVLALVAYEQPVSGDDIGRLRGKPSRHVLANLVHRELLRVERPDPKRRTPYYRTTERFLRLFNLETLEDLPKGESDDPP